jgi:hypothetical protein
MNHMKRTTRYLAAAIGEILRFAFTGILASRVGITGSLGAATSVYRYAVAAQLLFPAGLIVLWWDSGRYAVYKPLLLAGKLASAVQGFVLALWFLFAVQDAASAIAAPTLPVAAGFLPVLLDLCTLLCLVLPVRRPHSDLPDPPDQDAPSPYKDGDEAQPPIYR